MASAASIFKRNGGSLDERGLSNSAIVFSQINFVHTLFQNVLDIGIYGLLEQEGGQPALLKKERLRIIFNCFLKPFFSRLEQRISDGSDLA
mmetsp:Transcript_13162/g.22300  ORF Transcript_13162/g.22300 Transcript_13162/m.22300 type:complete len:91 (-) Transcript_13162:1172-1444(-)